MLCQYVHATSHSWTTTGYSSVLCPKNQPVTLELEKILQLVYCSFGCSMDSLHLTCVIYAHGLSHNKRSLPCFLYILPGSEMVAIFPLPPNQRPTELAIHLLGHLISH